MRAVRVHELGGPEVLRVDDIEVPEPGPGEVRVRIEAAGVNFIDTYHREGKYPLELPATIGGEGGGVVDAVGRDVPALSEGDRVAFAGPRGAYAQEGGSRRPDLHVTGHRDDRAEDPAVPRR